MTVIFNRIYRIIYKTESNCKGRRKVMDYVITVSPSIEQKC